MRGLIRVLSSAVLLLISSAAYAADMVDVPDLPHVPAATDANGFHDWSGAYVGATAGYQIGSVFTRNAVGDFPGVTDLRGLLGGVNAGYNFQNGSMVYGLEADVNWSGFSGNRICAGFPGVTCNYAIDLTASLKGRFGVSMDQLLVFGEGGLSAGHGESTISPVGAPLTGYANATLVGLTVGVGAEYALSKSISLKAQYDYINWSERTSAVNSVSTGAPFTAFPASHTVKIGLNYKF